MDTITHIVIGAVEGELIAGKKLGKKAMLFGILANNLPDIDVLSSSFQSVEDGLLAHRGFTHSILFSVMMAPLLGLLFYRFYKQITLRHWIVLFGAGLFTHIFTDALTSYGTGWYEPFNHYRVSFNTIFVVDPFYTLAPLVCAVALLLLKRTSSIRTRWALAGFGISCLYLLFTFFNKYKVDKVVEENLTQQQIKYADYISTPTPLNNFLWYIVIREPMQYRIGYYSIFDKNDSIPFTIIPRNDNLLGRYKNNKAVGKLVRFSQDYYCLTSSDSVGVDFHDLRFGQAGGWVNSFAPFIFSYNLKPGASNVMIVQRGRFSGVNMKAIKDLVKRIKGR